MAVKGTDGDKMLFTPGMGCEMSYLTFLVLRRLLERTKIVKLLRQYLIQRWFQVSICSIIPHTPKCLFSK
jgi:hypothetical protein